MKKVIYFLMLLLLVNTGAALEAKAVINSNSAAATVQEEYIYVKIHVEGKTIVYVYLSDGITLVDIFEEED